ncbi:thioredoxin domain-containing protein [Sphingobium sp. EM0848]|uniref:thioredoxin domain-containing protein n=1 Tax=Sphingobium sp. EM0848 TaxID=2743473 RepID=UPI00159C0440
MKALSGLALVALSLTLASCGKNDSSSQPTSAPVAAVAPPAGTTWSTTFNTTPEGQFVMGNPNAKVKLVEYGSYTCSHCRDFSAESSEEIKQMVDSGKMSYEFRNFVRDPIDIATSLLARCGGKDIYYPLSEQFFANQNAMFEKAQALGDAKYKALMSAPPAQRFGQLAAAVGLIDFAKQRGISEDQAKQCLADTAAAEKLAKGVEAANQQYKIEGTPTFILNGVMVENTAAWSALKPKLKQAGI